MLTVRLEKLRNFSQQRSFKAFRKENTFFPLENFKKNHFSLTRRSALLLKGMCEQQSPIIFPDEKIAFVRTIKTLPPYYDNDDLLAEYHTLDGKVFYATNNICIDYNLILSEGLLKRHEIAQNNLKGASAEEKDFLESVIIAIDAVLDLAERYENEAEKVGNRKLAQVLHSVPRNPAKSFHEALQAIRFVSAMFYLAGNYQIGFGRLDQYLYPFYKNDLENETLTRDEAKELLAEFFISLNRDSDLYFGVQQGDNGQSVMLGGVKSDGTSAVNDLTYLALEVSCELKLIDPKINLRIDKNTPHDLLELGCKLTREGLGFPQYSNDEVVIPALVKHGYTLEDARNYTVAACWEFIIPGKAMDIVNVGALNFPGAVHDAFNSLDDKNLTIESLKSAIKIKTAEQVRNILEKRQIMLLPAPFVSAFMNGALESKADATESAKYKNIGIHGAGIANGADEFVVIKRLIEDKNLKKINELKKAVSDNFSTDKILLKEIKEQYSKVGNDDVESNEAVKFLFDCFADTCEEQSKKDKVVRPGSGTAQFYVLLADLNFGLYPEPHIAAGEDGRLLGEPLSSSLAPAQGVKVNGILSVLKSFSHIDYFRIMNGGPITVEFDPVSISTDEGLEKLSSLIRYFVELGNQQLQLNVLNVKTLEDAVKHPDRHRNLIVRVWGWSGYFCELAPPFQQQIIHRHKYAI